MAELRRLGLSNDVMLNLHDDPNRGNDSRTEGEQHLYWCFCGSLAML